MLSAKLLRPLAVTFGIALFAGKGLADEESAGRNPTVADYQYAQDSPAQRLDFWAVDSSKPAPVVVAIHGGGWINGDKSGYGGGDARSFLEKGIAFASINYRLIGEATEQHVDPPVKACLLDAARAVQTIRANAKQWNIDPQRVGLTGSSAGACTCLWLALHDDLSQPESEDPVARESTHVTCVAAYRAQTTLDPMEFQEWIPNADYGGQAFGFSTPGRTSTEAFQLLLANRERLLPLIVEYSPIKHVNQSAPPIYLDYPNQQTPPVIGQPDPAPAHSALNGLMLAEKLSEYGTEVITSYPGHEDTKYGSVANFLVSKLKSE